MKHYHSYKLTSWSSILITVICVLPYLLTAGFYSCSMYIFCLFKSRVTYDLLYTPTKWLLFWHNYGLVYADILLIPVILLLLFLFEFYLILFGLLLLFELICYGIVFIVILLDMYRFMTDLRWWVWKGTLILKCFCGR